MNKALNYLVISLLAIAPFIGFISVSLFDIGFYHLISLFTLIAFFITILSNATSSNFKLPKYAIYLLLFLIYTVVSDLFIVNKEVTLKYVYSNRILTSFMLVFIIENTNFSWSYIRKIFSIIKIILVFAFVVILIQQLVNENFFVQQKSIENRIFLDNEYTSRLYSIFSWVSIMDIGLGFIPLLSIVLSVEIKKKSKFLWFWYGIGIIYSVLTKARWIMLGFAIISLMIFVYRRIRFDILIKYSIIGILFIIISFQGLKLIGVDIGDIVYYRILEADKGKIEKMSAGTRIFAFQVFSELFPENPIIGKGKFHSFGVKSTDTELISRLKGKSSQIHVGYLSLFYYYGIIGGITYILFLINLFKRLYKVAQSTKYWGSFFGFLIFLSANATLVYFPILSMGIIIGLAFNKYYSQQVSTSSIIQ